MEYDERSLQAIAAICEEIQKQKRTLLFSTFDYQLIERCATHIAPLYDGRLLYTGTVEAFVQTWDHLSTIIQDAHITAIRHAIETAHSDYTVLERDQTLYVGIRNRKRIPITASGNCLPSISCIRIVSAAIHCVWKMPGRK